MSEQSPTPAAPEAIERLIEAVRSSTLQFMPSEVERELCAAAARESAALREDLERFQQAFTEANADRDEQAQEIRRLTAERDALKAEVKRLREALESISSNAREPASEDEEPPSNCMASFGNADDVYSDGFHRALLSCAREARAALTAPPEAKP